MPEHTKGRLRITRADRWPGEIELWDGEERIAQMGSGSDAMHDRAKHIVACLTACEGMENPEEEVPTAKAQAQRMEWTVLDNAKQRMKVADLEAEIAALRAQLAEAERERDERGARIVLDGERFERLSASYDEACDDINRLLTERDAARDESAATEAALDEAVGLMHEAEGLLRVTYFTPNEKVDAINRWRTGCAAFLAAHAARRRRASPMPDHVIGEALVHELRVELNDARCALEAVLLFHSGGDWTDEKRERWLELTGNDFATTRSLCDFIRRVVGVPVLLEAEVKTFRTFDDLTAHVRALCFAAREPVRAHARRVHAFFAENPGARRFTDDDVEYVVEER